MRPPGYGETQPRLDDDRLPVVLVVLDGLGDRPSAELDGSTPAEAAHTPVLDALTAEVLTGLIPDGMHDLGPFRAAGFTVGPVPVPVLARSAVPRPCTPTSASIPCRASSAATAAADRCSANAVSGWACRSWDRASRSGASASTSAVRGLRTRT